MNYLFMYYLLFDVIMLMFMIIPTQFKKFHPLILSLILVIYSIILSIKMNYLNKIYWYSYILFLVFVGGIMILFLYLTSISNNEFFLMDLKYYIYNLLKILLLAMIFIYMLYFLGIFNYLNIYESMEILNLKNLFKEDNLEYKNVYMNLSMDSNIYLVIYLFLTMILCVMILLNNTLPFREMYKK